MSSSDDVRRQASWQKTRQTLTWAEKVRIAEAVRDSSAALRRPGRAATGLAAEDPSFSVESNKAVVRRIYVEGFNGGDESVYTELYHPDFHHHSKTIRDVSRGAEGERESMLGFHRAIPDVRFEILEELGEADRVMVRLRITGTLREPYGTLTAIGEPVSIHAVALFRLAGGRAIDEWFFVDSVT